jgi:uncharacterized membrane protein YkoI
MKTAITFILASVAAFAAEKKVKLESLPAALQAAIQAQTKGATIGGITTETEKGKTTYEVETTLNGRSRDLVFDRAGAILTSEDEVELDSIPAAAKAAIQKKATGGKITKVEKLTAGSTVSYEATITTKSGRKTEYGVNADGTPHRE